MKRDQIINEINAELDAIFNDKSLSSQERGELGERAVGKLLRYWAENFPKTLTESSFIFPQGPIMPSFNTEEAEPVTEIDFLLITPYKIFVVEIKTIYGDLIIEDDFTMKITRNGKEEVIDKNYLRQNEMHCRHLYHHLHRAIPKGDPTYIEQVLVFTGNMEIDDKRSDKSAHVTVTNNLLPLINKLNVPKENLISVKAVKSMIEKIRVLDKERLLNSQKFTKGDDKHEKED